MLDRYCERVGAGLWAEPANALSNLAFILAGLMAIRLYRREPGLSGREWDFWVLILALFAIGVGSGLWHLFATPWALRADTLPITVFINVYLLSGLFRLLRTPLWLALLAFAAYHVFNQVVARTIPPEVLNGSLYYLPSWLFLGAITLAAGMRRETAWPLLVIGFALFSLSLVFRTVDELLCPAFSRGTHFIWHLLNAVTLYILLSALFRAQGARSTGEVRSQ